MAWGQNTCGQMDHGLAQSRVVMGDDIDNIIILWVERYLVGLTLLVGAGTAIVVCVVATTVVLGCTIQLVGTAIVYNHPDRRYTATLQYITAT